MSIKIQESEIITSEYGEHIKKSELEKHKKNFEKINDLTPLILPSIKYHDHPLLEKIFNARKSITKFDTTPRLIDPRMCISNFGTTAKFEAAECDTCRIIVARAEENYDRDRAVKSPAMKIDSPPPIISKKRKSAPESGLKMSPSSKKQEADLGPQYDDDYLDKLKYEGNPADFEW